MQVMGTHDPNYEVFFSLFICFWNLSSVHIYFMKKYTPKMFRAKFINKPIIKEYKLKVENDGEDWLAPISTANTIQQSTSVNPPVDDKAAGNKVLENQYFEPNETDPHNSSIIVKGRKATVEATGSGEAAARTTLALVHVPFSAW